MTKKSTQGRKGFTRRQLLKASAAGASGLALTSAVGIGPRFLRPTEAWAEDLAPGMTGGPTGFPGAERYQYNENMSEGRAIEGIKKLKAAGKTPKKLVMLITDGAIGHFTKRYPASAPTVKQVWERETGIELEFIGVSAEDLFTKVLQDVTTKSGAYDIYTHFYNHLGDLYEAGGLVLLDDYFDKYKPDFDDPKRGAPTKQIFKLLYTYAGHRLSVSFDGDFQVWVYRKDLFNDPKNKKEFADKYGSELGKPCTWEQVDQISEFFKAKGLNGHTNLLSPFWGISNWYNRYASKALPNMFLFDEDGNPLIDTDEGIKATEGHVRSLKWASPDALSWTWAEAYGSMANLGSVMICTYSNLPKFNDRYKADGTPATPVTGKLDSFIPPGNLFGSDLVRRSCLYLSNNAGVSTQSKYPEAAYLFLQWAGSTRIYSWLTANPGGYFDPFQLANFDDPLVIQSYHDYHVPVIRETIKRSVPTMNFPGAFAMHNMLDENLQAALTGQITPKEAMQRTAKAWKRHIRKKGRKRMIEAINASRAMWPTVIDENICA